MKLLIYGLDGGDLEIMNIFKDQMPFFQKFLSENKSIKMQEDLVNRGWVEILTGKYGKDTRGFYMAPKLDGTHKCSTSFNMKVIEKDENIVPIWELAENNNIPYLIMNVPTTTPVPDTKHGIIVGSAGGGLNKIVGIPDILVSDNETKKYLEENNYIVDIRIPNDEIGTTEDLFERVSEKELKRTECFIELCNRNKTEFGFLVNRGNTIVEYLCRSVIEEYKDAKINGKKSESWVIPYLERHFKELDYQIKSIYKELSPEHFIITADHSIVPSKYWANVNPFLIENNFLLPRKRSNGIYTLKRFVKIFLGKKVKKLSKGITPSLEKSFSKYDWDKSLAFGHTYIPGIFINDKKRFNGPVDNDDIADIVENICYTFNNIPEAKRLSLKAVPYRRFNSEGNYSDCLPDIKIEGSDGIFFHEDGETLLWQNPNYGPIPKDLSKVSHAAFSGDKGNNPICVMSKSVADFNQNFKNDLTLVYKVTKKIIES